MRLGWTLGPILLAAVALALIARHGFPTGKPLPVPLVQTNGFDPVIASAIAEARAAAVKEPKSASARSRLGMVLLAHDVRAPASECFAQAAALDPKEARWPYLLALAELPEKTDAAVTNLGRALPLFPSAVTIPRLKLANTLLSAGRMPEAEALYREVLDREPGSSLARLGLGKLAASRGQFKEAADLLAAAKADPCTRKAAHRLLLTVSQRLGRTNEAAQLAEALAGMPNDLPLPDPYLAEVQEFKTGLDAWLDEADALLKAGQWNAAVERLDRIIRTYPKSDRALFFLGRARFRLNDLPGAEEALAKAAELAPGSVEALVQLGVVQLARGRPADAQRSFRRAIEAKPNLPEGWFNLGLALGSENRAESTAAFREAIRLRPTFAEAYLGLAVVLRADGKDAAATAELNHALELHPPEALKQKLLEQLKLVGK